MKKYVTVNFQSLLSIQKAERRKRYLENKGYNLIKTDSRFFTSILTYEKQ